MEAGRAGILIQKSLIGDKRDVIQKSLKIGDKRIENRRKLQYGSAVDRSSIRNHETLVNSMVCIYIWVIYVVFFKKNNELITSAQTLRVLI